GEADGGSVVLPVIVLQLFPVPAAPVEALNAAEDAVAWSAAASAADLDVIPARKIELRVVEPPRHVEMHAADAVLVVRHAVAQLRNVSGDREPSRIGEIATDRAARVREAIGEARRRRVQQQPRRLAR